QPSPIGEVFSLNIFKGTCWTQRNSALTFFNGWMPTLESLAYSPVSLTGLTRHRRFRHARHCHWHQNEG
ncbi:MAG: hypothetical protein AAFZ49_04905, partial [Cyanobacteria bacterium J06659_2]